MHTDDGRPASLADLISKKLVCEKDTADDGTTVKIIRRQQGWVQLLYRRRSVELMEFVDYFVTCGEKNDWIRD